MSLALYEFDSLPDLPDITGRTLPINDSSIIGHAALTGKTVVVADAYELPPDVGFENNLEFDRQYGYHRRSMLVVPMANHSATASAIPFVNRKSDPNAKIRTREDADRW